MENLEQLEQELNILIEEKNKLLNKAFDKAEQINNLKDKISDIKFGDEISLEKIMAIEDWAMVTGNAYKNITNYLEENVSYLYQSGYWEDTGQVSFKITTYIDDPRNHLEEFESLISLIRPNNEGKRRVNIMDAYLSKYGCYYLVNGTMIEREYYRCNSVVEKFNTTKEALDFIYENLMVVEDVDMYD